MGTKHTKLKPRDLKEFCEITQFNEVEIKGYFKSFIKKSPNGKMSIEMFKNMYADFFPDGDASSFAEHTFRAFDKNGDGWLEFKELMVSMSMMKLGSMNERLMWAFNMYDIDGSGFITRKELEEIMTAVTKLSGLVDAKKLESVAKDMANEVFKKVDKNADGVLSLEEFIEAAKVDENLAEMLQLF